MQGNVLVVDDYQNSRDYLAEMLSAQGLEVRAVENGRQAIEEFERARPDLVLLDVLMPELDGFEVCRKMKSHPEGRLIPVILVTGLSASEDRVRGINVGADDFLSKPLDRNELFARVRSLLNLKSYTDELERAESVLFALARSIEAKDPYTEGHCERLSQYSAALAQRVGLPEEQCVALRRGGIVHDIGKVAVPEHVLLKPGPLTPEERQLMEQHPVVGESICSPLRSFRHVLPIIRHHHERRDGSGYPDGLDGEAIPLTARILQIVDVYDALTTDRPYRRALPSEDALGMLRDEVRRGWWDGQLVHEFEDLLLSGWCLADCLPPGSKAY